MAGLVARMTLGMAARRGPRHATSEVTMTADPLAQAPAAPPIEREYAVRPESALGNPVPLGLFAYGMTVCVLALALIDLYSVDAMVLSMIVIFGGLAELIVGLVCARRGETFTTTVFSGLGLLFLTYGFLLIGGQHGWWPVAANTTAVGWYLLTWAVFAAAITVASAVVPRIITAVLGLSTLMLIVLAIATWSESDGLTTFVGWWGLVTGLVSIVAGFGLLVNEVFRRDVVPVGAPLLPEQTMRPTPPRPRTYAE
jgi:uncharacterized protein